MGENDDFRLIRACEHSLEDAAALLASEPELLEKKVGVGETPLHHRAIENEVGAVRFLHEWGADLEALNDFGESALRVALRLGNTATVDYLLAHGADLQSGAEDGMESMLHEAAWSGDPDLVRRVLARGIPVAVRNAFEETPLFKAITLGRSLAAVQALVAAGADVNARAMFDVTPLVSAAREGLGDICRFLLASGADPRAREARGLTAADEAAAAGHLELATTLAQLARRERPAREVVVRAAGAEDLPWRRGVLVREWLSTRIASRGRVHDAAELPALVAWIGDERAGLLTYRLDGRELEVVTLNAFVVQRGVGTALLAAAERIAREHECTRVWLVTTNDNVRAQAFHHALGWTHVATHEHAVAEARRLKPEIPEHGYRGIPIRDELEYERVLDPAALASRPARPNPRPTVPALVAAVRARGVEVPPGLVAVSEMGDSPELSRKLIDLVRSGRKRATAALEWSCEHDGERLPEKHQLEIVVDHTHEPALVVRLTAVNLVPFRDVTAEYAALEGEGDLSLEHWRAGHRAFFSRECARIGREPAEDMPVVCTEFEVVAVVPPADERPPRT